MQVEFRSSKHKKAFESREKAVAQFGESIGKQFVKTINLVQQAQSVEELKGIPQLRFHRLKGNRSHEYSATVTGNVRLILTFPDERTARVEKVEDYHGK